MTRSRSLAASPPLLAGGALLGVAAGALAGAGATGVLVGLAVGVTAVAAGVADLRERRIPNEIVVAALLAAAALAVVVAVADSDSVFARTLAGAIAAGAPLLVVHLVSPAGLGFGDVKLAIALGALLGVVAWVLGLLLIAAASLLALVGVAIRPRWRGSIPFGACLGAGALLVLACAGWIADTWAL